MAEEKIDWKKILEVSKKLEKEKGMDNAELARMKKCSLEEAERLRKLLAEQWFVKDLDVQKKKTAKKQKK